MWSWDLTVLCNSRYQLVLGSLKTWRAFTLKNDSYIETHLIDIMSFCWYFCCYWFFPLKLCVCEALHLFRKECCMKSTIGISIVLPVSVITLQIFQRGSVKLATTSQNIETHSKLVTFNWWQNNCNAVIFGTPWQYVPMMPAVANVKFLN